MVMGIAKTCEWGGITMKSKRLMIWLTVLLLVCMLAACGETQATSAYELVDSAVEKTAELDAVDMTMTMDTTVDGATVPMKYEILSKNLDSDDPITLSTITSEMMGQSLSTQIYREDGYYYLTVMDRQVKVKSGLLAQYEVKNTADSVVKPLPEAVLANAVVKTTADGTRTINVTLTEAMFNEHFGDFLEAIGNSAADGAEVIDYTLADIVLDIEVDKKGYIQSYRVQFAMDMDVKDDDGKAETREAKADATVTYNNPGQKVSITPPKGYKDFPEAVLQQ